VLQAVVNQLLKEIGSRESQVADLKRALAILNGGAPHNGAGVATESFPADNGRMPSSDVYLALKANPDGVRILDIAGDLKKPYSAVSSALARMKKRGIAEPIGGGLWKVIGAENPSPIVTPSQADGNRPAMIQYLREHPEGVSPVSIRDTLGIKEKTINSALQAFRRKGIAKSIGHGRWVLLGDQPEEQQATPTVITTGAGGKPAPAQDSTYAVVQRHPEGIRSRDIVQESGLGDRSVPGALTILKHKGLVRDEAGLWFPVERPVETSQKKQPGGRVQPKVYHAVMDHPEGIGFWDLAKEVGLLPNTVSSFLSQLAEKNYIRHEGNLYFPK
jgi:predicted DNA-binding transcriptional regulator